MRASSALRATPWHRARLLLEETIQLPGDGIRVAGAAGDGGRGASANSSGRQTDSSWSSGTDSAPHSSSSPRHDTAMHPGSDRSCSTSSSSTPHRAELSSIKTRSPTAVPGRAAARAVRSLHSRCRRLAPREPTEAWWVRGPVAVRQPSPRAVRACGRDAVRLRRGREARGGRRQPAIPAALLAVGTGSRSGQSAARTHRACAKAAYVGSCEVPSSSVSASGGTISSRSCLSTSGRSWCSSCCSSLPTAVLRGSGVRYVWISTAWLTSLMLVARPRHPTGIAVPIAGEFHIITAPCGDGRPSGSANAGCRAGPTSPHRRRTPGRGAECRKSNGSGRSLPCGPANPPSPTPVARRIPLLFTPAYQSSKFPRKSAYSSRTTTSGSKSLSCAPA